jgi:hypothetical protein
MALLLDFLTEAGAWLGVAFALGLVHAFDADHVMAISVFASDSPPVSSSRNTSGKTTGSSSSKNGARRGIRAGLRWSGGHGLVLLAAGMALFGLGRMLPPELSALAERAVGLLMVGLGLYVFVDLARNRRHVHFHAHAGLPPHAHWHSHADAKHHPAGDRHRHEHAASMVGALHGLAGSAPILALLPAAARSPALGLAFLVVFGLGVALAMALVSGVIGHLAGRLSRGVQSSGLRALRGVSAAGSMGLGVWLTFSN